jgi:capsular polysaccharide biosynthesis protein
MDDIELRKIINVIKSRFKLIILGIIICTCIAMGGWLISKPSYRASASIMIAPPSSMPSGLHLQKISIPAFQEICTSSDVVDAVKQRILNDDSLNEDFNLSVEALQRSLETEVIEEEIGINLKETSPLIHLRAYYSNPVLARKLVQYWGEISSEKISSVIRKEITYTLDVIEDEFARVSKELEDARTELKNEQIKSKPEMVKNQVSAQTNLLSQVRMDHKTKKNRLEVLKSTLKSKNEQRSAQEEDGLWVGSLRFEARNSKLPDNLKSEHVLIRNQVINARKDLVNTQKALREYKQKYDIALLNMRYNRKLGILVTAEMDLIGLRANLVSTKSQLDEVEKHLAESQLFWSPRRSIDADTLLERLITVTSKEELDLLKDLGVREEIVNPNHSANIGTRNSLNVNYEKYKSQIGSNEANIVMLKKDIDELNRAILNHDEKIKDLSDDITLAFQVHEDLTGQYRKLVLDIQSLQTEIDSLEKEVTVLANTQFEMKAEVVTLSDILYESNMVIETANRKLGLKLVAFNDLGPKMAALKVLANEKTKFCHVAAQAVEPQESLGKSWLYTLILAVIAGFFISTAVVLAGEYLFKE